MPRTILHVDLDAFYASVEQRDDPALRGREVIVGGPAPRGVVCAASYEARRFGVRSAMPTVRALQLCPRAVLLPPRMEHYATVSAGFFAILRRFSPLVEALSLDEAFLDGTGEERLLGDGPHLAAGIKARVREELELVASVGVAPSKFVAKVASDLGKPDGLLVVAEAEVTAFLGPLPVARLWGVGEVTERSLAALGLRTIADLARLDETVLAPQLGRERALHLLRLARGEDDREVVPDRAPVSVGSEETFDVDRHDRPSLRPHLLVQADRACARLRALERRARTVTLKVKYGDHQLVTRSQTLARPSSDGRVVGEIACALLEAVPAIDRRGVRLTGVSLSGLVAPEGQLSLALASAPGADAAAGEKGEQLGRTLDRIAARFGRKAVQRAVHVPEGDGKRGPRG